MKLAFVGGGVMAEAIIRGILSESLATSEDIFVGEISEDRCKYLSERYQIHASTDNAEAVARADLVFLAVKPQNFADVAPELRETLVERQTALSIVAGLRMGSIQEELDHDSVIRVMPNTPAQVGAGMTVWLCSDAVPEPAARETQSILATLGQEVRVDKEEFIDMATALSASGPGYVFMFIESLIDAGVYLGMPRPMASQLALQTVLGSAKLAQESGTHPAELRNMVTSPGGTTAEGLLALEEGDFRNTVMSAVIEAYEKALSLAEE